MFNFLRNIFQKPDEDALGEWEPYVGIVVTNENTLALGIAGKSVILQEERMDGYMAVFDVCGSSSQKPFKINKNDVLIRFKESRKNEN